MWLRALLAAPVLAGCSLIYNPSDLPLKGDGGLPPDVPPDAEIILDADPNFLELERVSPAVIFEGTGTAGGRQGVITVIGKQIVAGAKISITAHDGTSATGITVDDDNTEVAGNGFIVAAPITIDVNPDLPADQKLQLDVTVTQPDGNGGMVSRTLTELVEPAGAPVLELQGLDELTGDSASLPTTAAHEFSIVSLTGDLTAADATAPLIVRARGGITVMGTVNVSAAGKAAGPFGGAGGDRGTTAIGAGKPGVGPSAGQPSGGGAGFGTAGTKGANSSTPGAIAGVASLPRLDDPNTRGSGGAGGNAGIANGGDGGGGGGTIELTAGGDLTVGAIASRGGNGADGASDGGGGSGGALLLRGASVTAPTIDVSGGVGPDGGNGGTGGLGRVRIDVPADAIPAAAPAEVTYRGPKFAATTPLITRNEQPMVTVFGQKLEPFQYFFTDETGAKLAGPFDQTIGPNNTNSFPLDKPLFRGLNKLCILVDGGDFQNQRPEALNCLELVFLIPPQ